MCLYSCLSLVAFDMVGGKDVTVQFLRAPSSLDDRRTPRQAEHDGKMVCEGGGDGVHTRLSGQ